MNRIILIAAFFLGSGAVFAQACPTTVYYRNGATLKSGSYFYYDNGRTLASGGYVYYPNGNALKAGSNYYYERGSYLKSGNNYYYSTGQYLISGNTAYYDNGAYLKSGSTFYHKNGRYARSGSTLYREDGTVTQFPVVLQERVTSRGRVAYRLTSARETFTFDLQDLIYTDLVRARVKQWTNGLGITLSIRTGYPNEIVMLKIGETGNVVCELDYRR